MMVLREIRVPSGMEAPREEAGEIIDEGLVVYFEGASSVGVETIGKAYHKAREKDQRNQEDQKDLSSSG